MLNLKKYVFICTDFSFMYDQGVDAEFKKTHDPNFVKGYGFALDGNFNPMSCYFFEDFSIFGMSKEDLSSALSKHPIFKGLGSIRWDKNYRQKINLDDYKIFDNFDFTDIVDLD